MSANLTISPPSSIGFAKGTTFSFEYDYTDLAYQGVQVTQIIWDFGDGNKLTQTPNGLNKAQSFHVYENTGVYAPFVTLITSKLNANYVVDGKVYINSISPLNSGYAKGTNFIFKLDFVNLVPKLPLLTNADIFYYKAIWDFGDGNRIYSDLTLGQTTLEVEHIYAQAGNYTVSLLLLDNVGYSELRSFTTVTVDNFYQNKVTISGNDLISTGSANTFTINVTSVDVNEKKQICVIAYLSGSNSTPDYAVPPKWNFLTPRWRFVELGSYDPSLNKIGKPLSETILLTGADCKPAPNVNSNSIIAVSATYSFDYIDDTPGNTCLIVGLSSSQLSNPGDSVIYPFPSYSNTSRQNLVLKPIQVTAVDPYKLKVTENWLNGIYPVKWINVPIPIMISCDSSANLPTFNYPTTDNTSVVLEVSSYAFGGTGLKNVNSKNADNISYFTQESTPLFKKSDPGYVFTSITPTSALSGIPLRIKATSGNLTGYSNEFKVYDLDNAYTVAKINDNFDFGNYFYTLTLPSFQKANSSLFEYMSAIGGDSNLLNENLGQVCYEKISNFVSNHSDFQTAEIDKLLSLCAQMKVDAWKYASDYPTAVKKMLNLFSIPKHRLRGIQQEKIDLNAVGSILEENSILISGNFYFLRDKFTNAFILVQARDVMYNNTLYSQYKAKYLTLPDNSVRPGNLFSNYDLHRVGEYTFNETSTKITTLDADQFYWITKDGQIAQIIKAISPDGRRTFPKTDLKDSDYLRCELGTSIGSSFTFYEAKNINADKFYQNIIDWNSPYTNTFSYSLSSNEDWYGENGLIEIAFNNLLTKHLFQE